jgi:hypothetical protein
MTDPKPDPTPIDKAWSAFADTMPDRSELSIYQMERTREIFTAGFRAGMTSSSLPESSEKSLPGTRNN